MFNNGRSLINLRVKQLKYTGINIWNKHIIIIYLSLNLFIYVSSFMYLCVYFCVIYLFNNLFTYLLCFCEVIIFPTCRPRTGHLRDYFQILIMHRKTDLENHIL